uniref:Potassium channel domain-containing protein n=1 Tax=Kwoniella bestiolae CBS 10118 TaxID=1296100 RepID=A0A1B9FRJ5_9TREE|nr:hypothetical protein I302_09048 [Kwoniella bestiolae CBS 10118]OCF21372.1 hypothetical protein I302_09048 [Kwoniella bestiolae CBS 10118]
MTRAKEAESNDGESLPTSYKTKSQHKLNGPRSKGKGRDTDLQRTHTWHGYALRKRKPKLKTFAKYCPLVSAIFAPLSTLLDIPALTQHWYAQNGIPQQDPKACLILSGIGLGLNIIANILLVMRFSAKSKWWWKHSTRWSLICWIGKTVVAAVNLIVFGILSRNSEGWTYLEGFWCAVISIIDAGIISITLLFHYFFAFKDEQQDHSDIRSEGRRFMLSVTAFISILAVQSLVFSRIEHWSYSDGIYFSTQVALTIGYGDFAPTTAAGKVLVFPFSVLTISQLGNEIAQIIGFISSRAEDRRDKWRRKYESAMHREANKVRPRANLTEEMALIHQINQREELMSQMYDLFWSALSLLTFWLIGATMFSQIEGWPYGDAIYVVMILSLTIGFGDFTPVQPAGKVVFIVYALMAVPIVTSFAVQTITGLASLMNLSFTYSERGAAKEAFLVEQRRRPEAFAPHSDLTLRYHESYDQMRAKSSSSKIADAGKAEDDQDDLEDEDNDDRAVEKSDHDHDQMQSPTTMNDTAEDDDEDLSELTLTGRRRKNPKQPPGHIENELKEDCREDTGRTLVAHDGDDHQEAPNSEKKFGNIDEDQRKLEIDMLRLLLKKTVQLEAEARQMLLDSMDKSVARTLLLADRNVQARDVRALDGDDTDILAIWQGEFQESKKSKNQASNDIENPSNPDSSITNNQTSPAQSKGQLDMLSRVRRYRDTFAEILVVGSILQRLEGEEKEKFERWRAEEEEERRSLERERQNEPHKEEDGAEDIDKLAEHRWDGLTFRIYKRWARKVREKDIKKWETV